MQRVVDRRLDSDIDGARGVVKHQDWWILKKRTRNRDSLPLPARQCVAAFTNNGVVAVAKFGDELVRLSGGRSAHDVIQVCVG